jgi:hypothetical protein
MKSKAYLFAAIIGVLLLIGFIFFFTGKKESNSDTIYSEGKNELVVVVDSIGEINRYGVKSAWKILQNDSVTRAKNIFSMETDTLFVNENEHSVDSSEADENGELGASAYYDFESEYKVLFVIGQFVSYSYSYNGSGGAHPIYGSWYRTARIDAISEVTLQELFPDSVIYMALIKDSTITSHLGNRLPKDLKELCAMLDGGCEIEFGSLLTSYVFSSVKKDSTEIEFGLTYGCEAMRGNFTSFIITLPTTEKLKKYL